MHPNFPSKNKGLQSIGENGHGLDFIRISSRHHQSRFAREKPPLSRQGSQSLKFKDKGVRIENSISPPYADLPLEFVKKADNGYLVQATYSGNQKHPDDVMGSVRNKDELVKYMSKVPKYLQKGEMIQDNVLNFGVLDWGRLEKFTHKRSQSSAPNSEALTCRVKIPICSHSYSAPKVDFSPVAKPLKGKLMNPPDMVTLNSVRNKKDKFLVVGAYQEERYGKSKSRNRDTVDLKSAKGKEKCVYEESTFDREIPSSKPSYHYTEVSGRSQKISEHLESRDLDSSSKRCSVDQDSIILLLPKDFSRPYSSEESQKSSPHGKSAQHNWGSFSDFFFIDEFHTDETFCDIPPNHTVETEKDLDLQLHNLIRAQGVQLPDTAAQPNSSNMKSESNASDQITPQCSVAMNRESSRPQQCGFGLSRTTRSLSLKEGSLHPLPIPSVYETARYVPAKPEGSASSETSSSNKSNLPAGTTSGQLKRLLRPFWKPKVVNRLYEHSNDLIMKPPISIMVPELEKSEASTVKALLHLTVKSGLPLFKFVVETDHKILASTVKSLSSIGKDDISLMYTFYIVHKVRRKTGGWKNQKAKPCGFEYNVVGQMKVSKPQKTAEVCKVKESVLYSMDGSKSDAASSEFMTGRELAAIVVNNDLCETMNHESSFAHLDSNKALFDLVDEKLAQTMVILPGGDHSLPQEGVPSSLLNRWRTGGLCDCGGWDEGCKLRVLTNVEDDRDPRHSSSRLMDIRCDFYEQGESDQSSPFFKLVPFRDGLFSVEFDSKMSCLQAFSICVAVINSKQSVEFGAAAKSPFVSGEDPERCCRSHPPLSPVGRV